MAVKNVLWRCVALCFAIVVILGALSDSCLAQRKPPFLRGWNSKGSAPAPKQAPKAASNRSAKIGASARAQSAKTATKQAASISDRKAAKKAYYANKAKKIAAEIKKYGKSTVALIGLRMKTHVKPLAAALKREGLSVLIYKGLPKHRDQRVKGKSLFTARAMKFKRWRIGIETARLMRATGRQKLNAEDRAHLRKTVKRQVENYKNAMYANHNAKAVRQWQKDLGIYIYDAKHSRFDGKHARAESKAMKLGRSSSSQFLRLERFMLANPGRVSGSWSPSMKDAKFDNKREAR